jgi:pilus assembly protein FimV
VIKYLRLTFSVLLAVAALVLPLSAWALGLGQIKVISQRDQPLLAEIPIISTDSSELEALQARLASPDTFARVGLSPPQGIVSDLQFSVALDARGRPVIRVTSAAPVQQSLLTFLVEVDWGQGRLVREYSALLDTPQTAAAPVQPPIQEATVDDGNRVVRLPEPEPTNPLADAAPTAVPLRPGELTDTSPADALSSPVPMPVPLPVEASRVEPVVLQPPAQPQSTAAPVEIAGTGETRTVRRGETLGGIATGLGRAYSLDQTIVALLRANPEAFIDGNANLLKAGAVLRIPDDASIARYTPDEAALVVREQAAQWRTAGRALPQPPAVIGAPVGDTRNAAAARTAEGARAARATAQARLEIVPPSANDAKRAGTRSGISAGGEGDMLRQQELQQTNESLAARSAEVEELKARVAELEQLQQKQGELIALKDSELAAAQQRLATTQAAEAGAAPAAAGIGMWLGVGAGLLVAGLLAWWLLTRKAKPVVTRNSDSERLAAAVPMVVDSASDPVDGRGVPDQAKPATPVPVVPDWNRLAKPAVPEPAKPVPPPRAVPTWHAGGIEVAPLNASPPGQGRLDLARAYLEMGDHDTARSLLEEVAKRGDTDRVREEATRLLDEMA